MCQGALWANTCVLLLNLPVLDKAGFCLRLVWSLFSFFYENIITYFILFSLYTSHFVLFKSSIHPPAQFYATF